MTTDNPLLWLRKNAGADPILAALIDVAEAVKPDGCGDHGCIIKRPVGLGTNAGCRCRREQARTRAALDAAIRKEMWDRAVQETAKILIEEIDNE